MKFLTIFFLCFLLCSCDALYDGFKSIITPKEHSNSLHVGVRTGGDNGLNKTQFKSNQGEVNSNKKTIIDGATNVSIGKYSNVIIITAILTPCLFAFCLLVIILKFFAKCVIISRKSNCKKH